MPDRSRVAVPARPDWTRPLTLCGVTGTNGKTTTTFMLASLLGSTAGPVLRTSTLGSFLGDEPLVFPRTYPGFLLALRHALDAGAKLAVLEVTSEVLARGFASAWPCELAVFTNLSEDHLDRHLSFEHYLASKAQLFVHLPPGGTAVLNADDPASELLAEVVPGHAKVVWYGRNPGTRALDLQLVSSRVSLDGTSLEFTGPLLGLANSTSWAVQLPMIGEVFADDATAAIAAARVRGVSVDTIASQLTRFQPPAGRFEVVATEPYVVVDYAHTPDALRRTVATARSVCRGRVAVVFGAGGDRDAGKRSRMGEAVVTADRVVITSDNPRHEPPAYIAQQVQTGLVGHPDVRIELDRRVAIEQSISAADVEDLVLIAGKGHETGQVIGDREHAFSDVAVAKAAVQDRGAQH